MSHGNGPLKQYHVHISTQIAERVKELYRQAANAGSGANFIAALRYITDRLKADPCNFGEPLYHLPALKLLVSHAVVHPLAVYFGVHEEQAIVFVREFRAFS